MRWIVNHCFDGGGLDVKFLGGDASVIFVQKLEDSRDEGCDFSCDGVAKGGDIFCADGLNDLLDEGYFEK